MEYSESVQESVQEEKQGNHDQTDSYEAFFNMTTTKSDYNLLSFLGGKAALEL